jgi:hypothetical protein
MPDLGAPSLRYAPSHAGSKSSGIDWEQHASVNDDLGSHALFKNPRALPVQTKLAEQTDVCLDVRIARYQ